MRMRANATVGGSMRARLSLPAALIAAVVVAEAAVVLLRPRQELIDPSPVDLGHYFTGSQIARARDFRGTQRLLGFATMGLEAGVLVLLVVKPPRRLRRRFRRPPGRRGRGRRRALGRP